MNIEDYIDKMKEIQTRLLSFIDDENDQEENFENLEELIKNIHFENNPHKLKSFLYLISKIANNHYRCPNFINKIEKVILIVKDLIKKNFDNITIFNIFRECKLIILFLCEENIMTIDDSVIEEMNSLKLIDYKYKHYLINEIDNKAEIKDIDEFKEKRKIGENDAYICKLIREDSIEEFIIYVNKNDYSLNSIIKPSLFETNTFLIKNRTKLIDYAAFFGSVQIFKYLYKNDADVNGSIWFYAVHGNNPELINFLEDNKITLYDKLYVDCFYESVACHHNDMANYIIDNYLPKNFSPEYQTRVIFKYYNFLYFGNNIHNNLNYDDVAFVNACKYDYYLIVDFFVKKNKTILLNVILNIFLNTIQTSLYILMIFTNILIILIAFQINKNLTKFLFFFFFLNIVAIRNASKNNNKEIVDLLLSGDDTLIYKYFHDFKKLTKFTIPSCIKTIGWRAFEGCTSLKQIIFHDSVKIIQNDVFSGCTSLEKIIIPPSVKLIESDAFRQCTSLKEIKLPPLLKSIKSNVFHGCSSLEKIKIPDKVTRIDDYSFQGCSKLKKIKIPNMVTYIGKLSFYECVSLTEIKIPDSVHTFGNFAFEKCSSLKMISLSSSLEYIGEYEFHDCTSLTQITIPQSVKAILKYAFCGCKSLKRIEIPSSVTFIDKNAFENCTSLIDITLNSRITSIREMTFKGCSALKEIVIPDSVNSIHKEAFSDCSSLCKITIPDSVLKINKNAFNGCKLMEKIPIPKSAKYVDEDDITEDNNYLGHINSDDNGYTHNIFINLFYYL